MNIFKILLFVILSFSSLSAQKKIQFKVKIDGYTEGVVQLVGIFSDENYLADTSKLSADGTVLFNKADGYQEGVFYLVMPDKANFQLLLANGENFSLRTRRGDLVNSMQVENSPENNLFFESLKFQAKIEGQFSANMERAKTLTFGTPQYNELKKANESLLNERETKLVDLKQNFPKSFFTKFKLAGQNPKLRYTFRSNGSLDSSQTMLNFRDDWWNDFDFTDERLLRTPVFFNKLKKYVMEILPQQPDTLVKYTDILIDKTLNNKPLFTTTSNWIAAQYKPGLTKLMDGEAVYSHIVLKYFTPERATWATAEDVANLRKSAAEMRVSLIGMVGQDVRAQNKNGQFKSIYGLNSAFTIVYIYNPDCEHCQEQTPTLQKVYNEWKSKGLGIFSIAANAKNREEWQHFANNFGVSWDSDVIDPQLASRFQEKYHIDNTPELYILDKNHVIIAKNLKPEQVPEILEKEMAKMRF